MASNRQKIATPGLEQLGSGEAFKKNLVNMLESTQMFGDFYQDENQTMANYMLAYGAKKGVIVFREGERTGHMCLLVEGRLELYKNVEQGDYKKLVEIRAGKSIGEMSVLDGLPYSATAITAAPSKLLILTRDNLSRITHDHPKLAAKVLWKLANLLSLRLRQTTGKLIGYL
ncbi:MAG: cyclic nucleotide-binding domain-containing protein [Gammaproteobacteria bacterium]